MDSNPFIYSEINSYNASKSPSTVHTANTFITRFFERLLMQRVINVLKWKIPKHWNKGYFLYTLSYYGWVTVFKTDKFGVIPQACGLAGYDVFYQPSTALVASPFLKGLQNLKIHKQCELIKMSPDYSGAYPIVEYYAELMALTMEDIAVNLVNSKFAYLFVGANENDIASLKKMYDDMAAGNPAVYADKSLFDDTGNLTIQFFQNNLSNNFIADRMFDVFKNIMNQFDSQVGIPNSNTDKKERLITDEENANNVETVILLDLWLETLQEDIERVIEMFPELKGQLSVEKRYKEKEANDGERNDIEPSGAL